MIIHVETQTHGIQVPRIWKKHVKGVAAAFVPACKKEQSAASMAMAMR